MILGIYLLYMLPFLGGYITRGTFSDTPLVVCGVFQLRFLCTCAL